jgi:hypothetical protein
MPLQFPGSRRFPLVGRAPTSLATGWRLTVSEVPFPTFSDGHREIVLCEAILRSQREQRWVNVPVNGS